VRFVHLVSIVAVFLSAVGDFRVKKEIGKYYEITNSSGSNPSCFDAFFV